MLDNTARMIGTVGIWISYAITMAFGVCRMNFSGDSALPAFLFVVALVSLAAVVGTWIVWRGTSSGTDTASRNIQ